MPGAHYRDWVLVLFGPFSRSIRLDQLSEVRCLPFHRFVFWFRVSSTAPPFGPLPYLLSHGTLVPLPKSRATLASFWAYRTVSFSRNSSLNPIASFEVVGVYSQDALASIRHHSHLSALRCSAVFFSLCSFPFYPLPYLLRHCLYWVCSHLCHSQPPRPLQPGKQGCMSAPSAVDDTRVSPSKVLAKAVRAAKDEQRTSE